MSFGKGRSGSCGDSSYCKLLRILGLGPRNLQTKYRVAVKELNLSYHIGETLLSTIYTYDGNLI